VNDVEFARDVAIPMRDAYLTHTSTSPNYQILASLDIGRRQMEFEGYELVQKAFELSMILRDRIEVDELLSRYFRALGPVDLIPPEFRASGRDRFRDAAEGWKSTEESWRRDEFALDPTRVTLDISRTGMDGNAFKRLLMDRFDVQVNKTSRNTVLLIIHIGSTRGMITYLLERLAQIAREIERAKAESSPAARGAEERRVDRLTTQHPPLPGFSCFHRKFREREASTPEGHLRAAFYQSQVAGAIEFVYPTNDLALELENGRELVSAGFITPYPPGYPVLVPGQLIDPGVVRFLLATNPQETHGFDPSLGLPVFTGDALEGCTG
jgi:arginine decarboxylase